MNPARTTKASKPAKARTKASASAKADLAAVARAQATAQRQAALVAFLEGLAASDKTIAEWAREQGLSLQAVYHVTNGRTVGARGESRAVLRAMGIAVPAGSPRTTVQAAA